MAIPLPNNLSEAFPIHIAGVRSLRCNECADWELTVVVPEEFDLLVLALLQHIERAHGIRLPQFMVKQY